MNIKANLSILDIIGHLLIWVVLTIITFGIALFFFPYSFSRFVINRTSVVDTATGVERKMVCDINIFSNIGHIVLWMIISVLTLGLGYIFYFYRVWNYALNNSRVQ
ncbi:DUF6693 family protein [Vreelandella venusta]|uniref:Uncharacterized protein n=1 Tax=Vreelandella venusta TaxID=44935 RepID=A0AAP9ZG41_9GAMM|nr:DUF6693 family protein [Halomonas venusta]MBR9925292.1 hypothetical protein [Gammaproteobacteria bacterium]AZM95075.1 hypothetical protein EI420_04935 [Halomonas venusta]MDX1715021.1 DUF6693 family protein [Halomonas venusta]NPT29579.1 hypothetical protein [Halomonas venusta]QPI65110.1 hypothetical protein IR195_05160 [Halomonas venusta]